ncbi:hypothetical protein [Leucobacter sp. cx-169]|uniref:hypothetical protein n=1 Tax=Leucobacter sp. cx-169 TaxID=2770549 RepID=UPI00165E32B7|nr:hypothetical protein [Leucobacter sp. cx-169]MBC9927369.1 hypothetical protein [Leucobacter sp. cx-169]
MSTQRQAAGAVKAGDKIGGQYAALERAQAASPTLELVDDPFADLRVPYWADGAEPITETPKIYSPGDYAFDPEATEMRVYRDECGKSIAALTVSVNPVETGALTPALIQRGRPLIADTLRDRYGATRVQFDGDTITFDLEADLHGAPEASPDMASDVLGEHTEFYRFHRETDQVTFDDSYLYSELVVDIGDGYFPDQQQIDAAKSVCAQALDGRDDIDFPQLTMIRDRGYATNAYDALSEAQKLQGRVRDHKLHLFRVTLSAELLAQDIRAKGSQLDELGM